MLPGPSDPSRVGQAVEPYLVAVRRCSPGARARTPAVAVAQGRGGGPRADATLGARGDRGPRGRVGPLLRGSDDSHDPDAGCGSGGRTVRGPIASEPGRGHPVAEAIPRYAREHPRRGQLRIHNDSYGAVEPDAHTWKGGPLDARSIPTRHDRQGPPWGSARGTGRHRAVPRGAVRPVGRSTPMRSLRGDPTRAPPPPAFVAC